MLRPRCPASSQVPSVSHLPPYYVSYSGRGMENPLKEVDEVDLGFALLQLEIHFLCPF